MISQWLIRSDLLSSIFVNKIWHSYSHFLVYLAEHVVLFHCAPILYLPQLHQPAKECGIHVTFCEVWIYQHTLSGSIAFLPPANEVCEGYVFTHGGGEGGVRGCSPGGACVVAPGGACMVAPGGMRGCSRGHAWLLPGGMRGCSGGACMVALGGHACLLLGGACMVVPGGHEWLLPGGHAWLFPRGGLCGIWRDTEIRSMSGRYASYWNAFLFLIVFFRCV